MAIRQNRLIGKVWGDPENPPIVTVYFNGEHAFEGTVPTTPGTGPDNGVNMNLSWSDMDILCNWTTDSSIRGNIPTSISISGGDMIFRCIEMTHSRPVPHQVILDAVPWPKHHPATVADYVLDFTSLTDEDFIEKYQWDKNTSDGHVDIAAADLSEKYFVVPNLVNPTSDGKLNVRLNGQEIKREDRAPGLLGEWHFRIPNQSILEFDYVVKFW